MALPTQAITILVKGLVGLFTKLAIPLTFFFSGKKHAETKQVEKNLQAYHEAAKISDDVERADDDELDRVLND